MISESGTSKAGPGRVRGSNSSSSRSAGVTNGTPKSRDMYSVSSPQTSRPRTKCGTRILVRVSAVVLVLMTRSSGVDEAADVGVDGAGARDLVAVGQVGVPGDLVEHRGAGTAARAAGEVGADPVAGDRAAPPPVHGHVEEGGAALGPPVGRLRERLAV